MLPISKSDDIYDGCVVQIIRQSDANGVYSTDLSDMYVVLGLQDETHMLLDVKND